MMWLFHWVTKSHFMCTPAVKNQGIAEENSRLSQWIADLASTGYPALVPFTGNCKRAGHGLLCHDDLFMAFARNSSLGPSR